MPNSQHHYYFGILPPPQLTIAQRAEKEATNQRERAMLTTIQNADGRASSPTSPLSSYSYFGHLKGRLFLPTSHFSVLFCPQPT